LRSRDVTASRDPEIAAIQSIVIPEKALDLGWQIFAKVVQRTRQRPGTGRPSLA
jgi:hypothetical protein